MKITNFEEQCDKFERGLNRIHISDLTEISGKFKSNTGNKQTQIRSQPYN